MLPAPLPRSGAGATRRFGLGDVMPNMLAAVRGGAQGLRLPPVQKAVVILIDGLGTHPLSARAGHARTIAPRIGRSTTINAGFPTTTASSLATLTTGTSAGEHGLVGYSVLDPAHDRIVNQLSGWDEDLDPATWQRRPTIFERAGDAGVPSFVVAADRYRDSGFTRAVLRGADYRGGASIADRMEAARDIFDVNPRALIYLYVPELDSAGHAEGSRSAAWTDVLEEIDGAVGRFTRGLLPGEGALLTADHGMLDIPPHAHVLFDEDPALVDGVRLIAGEPRALQLHLEPDLEASDRIALVERWRESEHERAWVATREEAIDAGWFGAVVDDEVRPRIGDVIVAARRNIAYYDSRVTVHTGRSMVGQHGSLSPAETAIPLIGFGEWDSVSF